MTKWLLALVFCALSMAAHAACDPVSATAGMIGCWPTVTTMGAGDFVDIWQPGPFPASANKITKANLFAAPGPIGSGTASTGAFTTLAATSATLSGSLTTSISKTWAGAWPGTNNVALFVTQTLGGTPGVFHARYGDSAPLNLIQINEGVNFVAGAGPVEALGIHHYYGGASSAGPRTTLFLDSVLNVDMPLFGGPGYPFFVTSQMFMTANANSGGTLGSYRGAFFAFNPSCEARSTATFTAVLNCVEVDFTMTSGADVNYTLATSWENLSGPAAPHAKLFEAALQIGSALGGQWNRGIYFGDPQGYPGGGAPADRGFPVTETGCTAGYPGCGSLISAGSGPVASGIDFLATHFTSYLIRGEGGMGIDGSGYTHTDRLIPLAGNSLAVMARNGSGPAAVMASAVNTPTTYPFLEANAGSTKIDIGGTAGPMFIAPANATSLTLGSAGITTQILGSIKGAAGSFIANGVVATALTNVGPAGSHTTVQEWFIIVNAGGTARYVPGF